MAVFIGPARVMNAPLQGLFINCLLFIYNLLHIFSHRISIRLSFQDCCVLCFVFFACLLRGAFLGAFACFRSQPRYLLSLTRWLRATDLQPLKKGSGHRTLVKPLAVAVDFLQQADYGSNSSNAVSYSPA